MARTERHTSANWRMWRGNTMTASSPCPSLSAEQPIVLRLPTPLLCRVDEVVKSRPIRIPRHNWWLEAVFEKLEREQA